MRCSKHLRYIGKDDLEKGLRNGAIYISRIQTLSGRIWVIWDNDTKGCPYSSLRDLLANWTDELE